MRILVKDIATTGAAGSAAGSTDFQAYPGEQLKAVSLDYITAPATTVISVTNPDVPRNPTVTVPAGNTDRIVTGRRRKSSWATLRLRPASGASAPRCPLPCGLGHRPKQRADKETDWRITSSETARGAFAAGWPAPVAVKPSALLGRLHLLLHHVEPRLRLDDRV